MGGFTNGQSTNQTTSPYAPALAKFGVQQMKTAEPINAQLGSQFLEALRTGGVNSFIPWITRALDSVRSAGSTGVEQLRQNLARSGFGGSSEGQAMLAQGEQQANQQTAMTPAQMIMQFITGAPAFASNTANSGANALSGAMSGNTTTTATPSFWDLFLRGAESGGKIAAAAAAA